MALVASSSRAARTVDASETMANTSDVVAPPPGVAGADASGTDGSLDAPVAARVDAALVGDGAAFDQTRGVAPDAGQAPGASAMSVAPDADAASLECLEGLMMSQSDMRRLAQTPATWTVGSPRPGDMVLCAKEPLRLGIVAEVVGNYRRKVELAGANGGSRFAYPNELRALPAADLAGRPSAAPRSVDEMVRGAVFVALGDLVDEVARRAPPGPGDAVAPREFVARRGSAGGGVELGAADASGDGRGVFYSRCPPAVNGGAVEVFMRGNAGATAQLDAAAAEASATLEPLHLKSTKSKSSEEYRKIARALGGAIAESGCGEEGISPAAALLLFAKRESRKLFITGEERHKVSFWKNSDFWTCVTPGNDQVNSLRLIPKRAEVTVPEPLTLQIHGRDYPRKGSEKHTSFSRVIAKAVNAAYAAAEQKPISIAAVLNQAEELEGCTVSIQGEDRKRLAFWKNSEFWDVDLKLSHGAKVLNKLRLLPKSAAPAVGKRAASGAAEPAKKKRARK